MADTKISGLPSATVPLAGTEIFEVVQSGTSKYVAATAIANTYNSTLSVPNGGTGAPTLTGYVKGNGTSAMTATATIPFADIAGRAYGDFLDTTDQTGSTSVATAVKFNTTNITQGISITNDGGGNPTRITFTAAGTYYVVPSLQFANSDSSDHDVTVWLSKEGVSVANSGTAITVPKLADGGKAYFASPFMVTVTAGQYVQIMWLPENTALTVDYVAAGAIAPAIPSAILAAQRIA